MRTSFIRCHTRAAFAIEGVVKEHRGDAKFAIFKLVKDIVGIKGPIIIADARMVSSHDEMGAPVVLSCNRKEYGLPWAGISHGCRKDSKHCPVFRIVILKQRLIAAHPYFSGYIIFLCSADQRMNHESVDNLKGGFLYILMGTVYRISCLKSHDPFPSLFLKDLSCISRIKAILQEILMLWPLKEGYLTPYKHRSRIIDILHARMLGAIGLIYLYRFFLLVVRINVFHSHQGQRMSFLVH